MPGIGEISPAELFAMQESFPFLVAKFKLEGKLTETDMDEQNIPSYAGNDTRSLPKDKRVLHQNRSALINHELVAAEYENYIAARNALNVRRATNKLQRSANKTLKLQQEEIRKKNLEEKRVARAHRKAECDAEKARKKNAREEEKAMRLPPKKRPKHEPNLDEDELVVLQML